MGCSRAPRHEYRGLFCGYEMVEDYDDDSLGRENFDLLLRLDRVGTGVDSIDREIALRVIL